jgi:Fe2+ transport system protein FeoA
VSIVLGVGDGSGAKHIVDGFRSGLREMGFVEGQNVAIEFHCSVRST